MNRKQTGKPFAFYTVDKHGSENLYFHQFEAERTKDITGAEIVELFVQTTEQETIARCEAYLRSRGFCKLAKDMKAELSK